MCSFLRKTQSVYQLFDMLRALHDQRLDIMILSRKTDNLERGSKRGCCNRGFLFVIVITAQ